MSARTEASDTWALPDGSFSVKRHGTVVRLWRDEAWVAADPSLEFDTDGSVIPKATSVAVKFSGGGTGPMLTGVKDGRTLSLTWSRPLPRPTLEANVATYAEVLPGVDLQLKAEVESFSQLLVVKTAAAAQNPELDELRFTMDTVGVDVTKDAETGMLTATDPAGQPVFTSPAPLMWDSTTPSPQAGAAARTLQATEETPAPADVFEPGAGSVGAEMGTAVSGDTLTITPDQELLTGTETTYPVYIDPEWAWGEWQHWTRVYQAHPDNSYWDAKGDVRVGYESQTGGKDRISRSFFQLDTSDAANAEVKSATFHIRNTWSWSCEPRPVELWEVTGISKKTTWRNQPGQIGTKPLSTVNDSKGWSSADGCAAGNLEFDATSAVRTAAKAGKSDVTLGLYAADETDTFGWKRFDPKTATLEIVFNYKPKKPYSLGTSPRTSCTAGGLVGNTTISLHATIEDKNPGNLTARFQVFKKDSTVPVVDTSVPAINKRVATLPLPAANTPSGEYTWRVVAKDADGVESDPSATCKFTIDRNRPSQPPVITSEDGKYPSGKDGWPTTTGPARAEAKFRLAPNTVTDVTAYYWWTDTDPEVTEAPVDPVAKTAVATFTVPSYGPHTVYAYSVDAAGNRSDTGTYLFYAVRSTERDEPGDLNGDGFKDIWNTDINGTLLTYTGQGGRAFYTATSGGATFPGRQITFSADWMGEDGYNDLISLEYNANDEKNKLRVYPNNGRGTINPNAADGYRELTVRCPVPLPGNGPCKGEEGWTGDDHWHNAEQIATGGDLNNDQKPDLLVKQGKQLWLYHGDSSGKLDHVRKKVILVGEADWDKFTVIVPGDLNGDTVPDMILRENTTGDLYRSYGAKDPTGKLDAATWGSAASRVKIANGTMPQDLYPVIGSSGDLDGDGNGDGNMDGDGIPDLWARKKDNTFTGWPGVKTGNDYTGIGAAFLIDGVNGGRKIAPGTSLTSGQSVTSNSAKLTMQADGNLVVSSNANKTLWSSGTAGHPGATARVLANGAIAVSSDSTPLWTSPLPAGHTGEGYALLQDRGNLVVYNAKGESLWSNGSGIRHDYNGDGRSDMAAWYVAPDNKSSLNTFLANSDGSFAGPTKSYESLPGSWNVNSMKFATGDYNGDGRGDMAALYDYGGGVVKLFTALGKSDGGFDTPFIQSWSSQKGGFYSPSMTMQSGDFNGDGRDDLMAWYSYSAGNDTLFTFTANVNGGFNPPFPSYQLNPGWWDVKDSKFATGDYNGDGRDDIAALYGYSNGDLKMHTFLALPYGGFAGSVTSWSGNATTWGDWDRTYLHSGDFNADGIDDVMFWYDYADGHDAMFLSGSTARDGKFGTVTEGWVGKIGDWSYSQMKIVPGDYNGDGRDDIGSMFGYSNGSVGMFTHLAKESGDGFHGATTGWSAPSGWVWSRGTFLRHYN
ncbi:FG-GAP-like repeat-containing protein [Streptomyces sp. NPDC048370]|uniref:FG-GAP-like repeat-containing protein n=1 Tax=Streptomyces sp. NPDC048370 TaxID=3365540 RepID=UPI00371ED786